MLEDLQHLAGEVVWVIRRHHRVFVNGVALATAAAWTVIAMGYMVQTVIAEA